MLYPIRLLILLLLLTTGVFAQPEKLSDRITAVENGLMPYVPVAGFPGWNLRQRMAYHRIPGMSVAVIKNYKIDWAKSYGLADTTKKLPVTNNTVFSAGSISKLVMAVVALRLVEQGKFHLDSPINNYLQSWKLKESDFTKANPVTLRMLLSHTGGTSQSAYFGYLPSKTPLPTVVEILSGAPNAEANPVVVNSEPGKGFRYSGGGSLVAQLAIMDLMKNDFATIAKEEVFDKLGMKNSSFLQPLPPALQAKAAWGYSTASWYKGMPYVYPQQAAAGLHTTATDLALFIIELQNCFRGKGQLLKASTMKTMLTPVAGISEGAYREQIGLGAFLLERTENTKVAGKYFEHQGANAGFISFAMGSVEDGNGVVILVNSGDDFNGFGTELRRSVAKIYGWNNFLPETIYPIKPATPLLDSYTGRYRKGPDEVLTLRREGWYLVENINESKDIYCFAVANDTIVFTDFNVKGYFRKDATGKINSLRNQYQSASDAMPRMKDDEFTPTEHLRAKRYIEAKEGFRQMRMNEYQLTYAIYENLNRKPLDLEGVKTLLELALEQHPQSSIVYSRWGDYYLKKGDKANAIKSYEQALALEPGNKEVMDALAGLRIKTD